MAKKEEKVETNKRRKRASSGFSWEEDAESKDWWTKYFASVEAMIQVIFIFTFI